MEEKIINVGLYGGKGIFGGKETPLEASVIYCDKFDKCSYYKNNQCLNVRSFLSDRCKYGKINNIKGYTSRAKKYYDFKKEWKDHEQYNKLSYPPEKLGLIDNEIVIPYAHMKIDDNLDISVPYFSGHVSYINSQEFTPNLIKEICNFRPQAMMGGEITSFHNEIIPLLLAHLKEILPDKYNEFKKEYPDYIKEVNYIGREALLKTIEPSIVRYESDRYPTLNEEWYWDGAMLIYKSGYVSSFNVTKDYEIEKIKVKPSDKSTIKISDNKQVTEKTIFVD